MTAVISPLYYQEAAASITAFFVEKIGPGLYVSLNKPVPYVKKTLERRGIALTKMKYIDGVTDTQENETDDCYFLGKSKDLTSLCIGASKAVQSIPGCRFVILDSISTLLIYNDGQSVARFAHLITEKLRKWGFAGAILSVYMPEGNSLVAQLAQFCDAVVRLGAPN